MDYKRQLSEIIHEQIRSASRYLCSSSRFHLEGWSGLFQQKLARPLGTQAVSYPRTRLLEKATGGCPRSHLDVSVPSSGLC